MTTPDPHNRPQSKQGNRPAMTTLRFISALLLAAVLIPAAHAEDIELFTVPPENSGSEINVLIVVDNSANWGATLAGSDKKTIEKAALTALLGNVNSEFIGKLRVGMMSFTDGNKPSGAKVIAAVEDLTTARAEEFSTIINAPDKANYPGLVKADNAPYASSLHEAFLYFQGLAPRAGTQDTGTYDPAAVSGGLYVSPGEGQLCGRNFVIFIGNGSPDSGEQNATQATLTALGGVQPSDPIPLTPEQQQSSWTDEYARLLYNYGIQTYVLDVYDNAEQQNNPWKAARALMKSTASKGAGVSGTDGADHYFAVNDGNEILEVLTSILNKIQAVNSVFAATALPVSVNVRGTYLNQVYMGVFRPDGDLKPLWRGNLKQYQLAQSSDGTLFMADQDGVAAQDTQTGFIKSAVTSFWTHVSSFFQFIPDGDGEGSDAPDGEIVEKGGVAQMIRDRYPTRSLYTCTGSCGANSLLSTTPFTSTHVSATDLGVSTTTERDAILSWMKGLENIVDENGDGALTGVRTGVHADVLHSRPAVVNYDNDHKIVIYYGTNDGVFHAVRGGQSDTFNDGTKSGDELWGFVPSEYFSQLKTIRNNVVMDEVTEKPYYADGAVTSLATDDEVLVFFGQRRGGRFLYALDVTDPTAPRFLWKRSNSNWPELGQTWAEPTVARVEIDGEVTDVLIFGAGYDEAANDALPQGTATSGRGIFVVDAHTGELIFEAGPNPQSGTTELTVAEMIYSIPSDVTPINRDSDSQGLTDRAYVGDTGGNIWRLDMKSDEPNDWRVHKLASLGSDQKFLYSPDVVYGDGYDAILVGAGDREKPFDTTITNRFYMVEDSVTSPWIAPSGTITTVQLDDLYSLDNGDDVDSVTVPEEDKGWYFTLASGEKVVSSALTASGTTYFSTNQPTDAQPNSCANLGTARIYKVNYQDGSSNTESGLERYDVVEGGGYIPSPTYGVVQMEEGNESSLVEAIIMGTNVEVPAGSTFNRRDPIYWFRDGLD